MNDFTNDFISFVSQTEQWFDDNFSLQDGINNLIIIGAITAVIFGELYHLLRRIKFSTPHQFADQFYFGLNLTPSGDNDERFGIAVKDYYLGLYSTGIYWGQTDENGCL